jgi:chaperonin GroES
MRLKPVNDKIVVKPIKKEDDHITEGGIILPDTAQNGALIEGKVVAVGEGMYSANGTLIPVVVDEGDTILYNKNAQKAEHKIDGEDYILMSINEVMSIVRNK